MKNYEELCNKVRETHPYIADWMESGEPKKLPTFSRSKYLILCFPFDETPFEEEFYDLSGILDNTNDLSRGKI